MSDYEKMLNALMERDPHNRDIQYAVAALIRADRDETVELAVELAQRSREHLSDDIAAELRWHPSERVRARAWSGTGVRATGEEWDRALVAETDADVLDVMRAVAPIADFPATRVWKLLGAKREKFTVPAARNLVESVGRADGAESWWVAALTALNPNTLPKATLEDIEAALRQGYATREVLASANVPWLFRAFAALAPNVPAGTLAGLASEAVSTGVDLREDPCFVLRRALHLAAGGSLSDRPGLKVLWDVLTSIGGRRGFNEPAELAAVAAMSTAAAYRRLLAAAVVADDASPAQRNSIAERLWHTLPESERTDALCVHTLATAAHNERLCQMVLTHLGDRASEVLETEGLAAKLAPYTAPEPSWWIHTAAPHAWVMRVRSRYSWGDATRYRHLKALEDHAHLRDLVWDDIVANPEEWDDRAAAIAVNAIAGVTELTDEQWLQLPSAMLRDVVDMNGVGAESAFGAVTRALARTVAAPTVAPDGAPEPSSLASRPALAAVTNTDVARTTALQHLCSPTIALGDALTASAAVA